MAMPDEEAAVGDDGGHPEVAAAAMKKSAWTKEEDAVLREQVQLHGGPGNWAAISEALPGRNPKSCRLRWAQHLSPTVDNSGPFTAYEDDKIMEHYHAHPNRWATIASFLSGRTDNAVKNRWHSVLSKKYHHHLQQLQQQRAAAAVSIGKPRHRRRLADRTLPLFPLAPGDVVGRGMSIPGLRPRHPPPTGDGVDLSGECLELFPLVPGDLVVSGNNTGEAEAAAAAMDVNESLVELRLWPSTNHESGVQGDDGAGSSGAQDFLFFCGYM